jgi:hypothetical protein
MAGGDDDYGDAFKKAKLEHDQQRESPTEAKRLQAEADADTVVLSNVVLPQLQAAAQKLESLGGKVDIRQYGRTGKTPRPTSVAFRIMDRPNLPANAMERKFPVQSILLARVQKHCVFLQDQAMHLKSVAHT